MKRQEEIRLRNDYIKNLNSFVMAAKNNLEITLHKLNWTENATIVKDDAKTLVLCPLDASHQVPPEKMDQHLAVCRWHRLGYRDDEVPLPSPPANLPVSSVVIDERTQRDLILRAVKINPSIQIGENVTNREVPQSSSRLRSDFTVDERRILYDHAVSQTAALVPQLKEFNITMKSEEQTAPMTREQLMATERDAKRRRVKHRTAKVHTKSKNYSEVLRAVIHNQMLAYEDWIKENFGDSRVLETIELEKTKVEESKQEKQEMVWLEWDFRGNPHTWWKHVLEKEKRKKESEENVVAAHEKSSRNNYYERKRGHGESHSKNYYYSEKSRKRKYDDATRVNHQRAYDYDDQRTRDSDKHSRRNRHHEAYSNRDTENKSRKDSQHYRHRKDDEKNENDSLHRINDNKSKHKHKNDNLTRKKEDAESTDVDTSSNSGYSLSSSHSSNSPKKKKSKKKRKHKHKKKHRKE